MFVGLVLWQGWAVGIAVAFLHLDEVFADHYVSVHVGDRGIEGLGYSEPLQLLLGKLNPRWLLTQIVKFTLVQMKGLATKVRQTCLLYCLMFWRLFCFKRLFFKRIRWQIIDYWRRRRKTPISNKLIILLLIHLYLQLSLFSFN